MVRVERSGLRSFKLWMLLVVLVQESIWRVRTAVRDLGCVPNKEHRLATCSGPPYLRSRSASHQPQALEWHWQLGQDKIAHAGLWRGFPVLLAVLVNTFAVSLLQAPELARLLSRDFA